MHQLVHSMLLVTTAFSWLLRAPGKLLGLHLSVLKQMHRELCSHSLLLLIQMWPSLWANISNPLLQPAGWWPGVSTPCMLRTSSAWWEAGLASKQCFGQDRQGELGGYWMGQLLHTAGEQQLRGAGAECLKQGDSGPEEELGSYLLEVLFKISGWGKQGNVSKTGLTWHH